MASDVTLADLRSMNVNQYFTLIAITLVVYEYAVTFVEEVERFWVGGPLNWASGFFYLNRYLVFVGHVPIMMEYFWETSNPAKMKVPVTSSNHITNTSLLLIVAAMLIMRMYALYERSRRVLGIFIGVSVVVVAIGLWAVLGSKDIDEREVDFPRGCSAGLSHDEGIRLGAAWTGMLVFDALVFGMTLYKSLALARSSPEINLLTVLLRDGAMYFAVMIASNLGNILTFVFGGPFTRGVVTTFTNVISSIMISRLMLNLRDPALVRNTRKHDPVLTEETFPNLTFVEPVFSTVHSTAYADDDADPRYEYWIDDAENTHNRRRLREAYHYLAMGTSQRNKKDVELCPVRRQ